DLAADPPVRIMMRAEPLDRLARAGQIIEVTASDRQLDRRLDELGLVLRVEHHGRLRRLHGIRILLRLGHLHLPTGRSRVQLGCADGSSGRSRDSFRKFLPALPLFVHMYYTRNMANDALPTLTRHLALLDEWLETRQQIARLEARAADLLAQRLTVMGAEVTEAPKYRDTIRRSMIAEYSAAGRVSPGSMDYAFTGARDLADFPAVSESFTAGRVTGAHAREITRAASVVQQAIADGTIDAGSLVLYEAATLEIAESDTPARTRAAAREIAAALAGITVTERHKAAEAERSVTSRPVGDGLALLQAVLPEHVVTAIMDRLTQMAKHVIAHPENRRPVFPDDEPELVEHGERDAYMMEDPRTGESVEREIWIPATADDLNAYWAAV